MELFEQALAVPPSSTLALAQASVAILGALAFVDALRVMGGPLFRRLIPEWPLSWECDNRRCYEEMFSEPTRPAPALVRRPGNTYSNFPYLLSSAVVVCDCVGASHAFWVSDMLFGVMLGWLSLCSLAWHATNSPTSQYFDLWAMDSSIAYLIVRFLLLAAYQAMVSFGVSTDLATAVAAWGCAAIYALSISANGLHYVSSYRARLLHYGCTFGGRTRVVNRGKPGNLEVDVLGMCLFCATPAIYMVVPVSVQAYVGYTGSLAAATWASGCLAVGWFIRLFEQFVLDGNPVMNAIVARVQFAEKTGNRGVRLLVLRFAAAVCSPTAHLHLWTGFTLLLGYAHVRTVDAELLGAYV